jgi:hypothetical protein
MNSITLQNPKYQQCIDSCNNCAEACEACCTACLNDSSNVGMMTRCIMMCRDCADMCRIASCMMARGSDMQNNVVICVLTFVKHVLWNVIKWPARWNNANNALTCVGHVLKNVVT